jgi:rhodanese-related sulfurtransferase
MTIQQEHGHGLRPISSEDLNRLLHDPDVTIVDVRPSAAYNGWRAPCRRPLDPDDRERPRGAIGIGTRRG